MDKSLPILEKWIASSPSAVDTIEVAYSKTKGRYLVAKRDIKKNEIIIHEKAYACIPNEHRKEFICDNCVLYNKKNISNKLKFCCNNCMEVFYCSSNCKEDASSTHNKECSSFQELRKLASNEKLHQSEKKAGELLCLGKLLIRVFLAVSSQEPTKEVAQYDYKYEDVRCLCTNLESLSKKKIEHLVRISSLVFKVLHPILPQLSKQEILELACIEESNAFGFFYSTNILNNEVSAAGNARMYGFGIYTMSSLLNHSCAPNLYKKLQGKVHQLRALHDIKKGTELCHSYIDLDKNTNQRRTDLQNHYGFFCICERCQDSNIEDSFLEKHVCKKYGCGGLLVSENPNNLRVCIKCCEEEEEEEYY